MRFANIKNFKNLKNSVQILFQFFYELKLKSLIIFLICFINHYDLLAEEYNLGQLLFIGIHGTEMTPLMERHLLTIKPGGIILFKRNIKSPSQIQKLNLAIYRLFKKNNLPQPFIAIDQEGGIVYRIPIDPLVPSAAALGRLDNPTLMFEYGKEVGAVLKNLGFNMNLAPVLDLKSKDSDFIGTRSFGMKPELVSQLAMEFSKGLLIENVLPCGKHFPGAGGLRVDPHLATPVGNIDWSTSWNQDLKPFRDFAELELSALMLSHVRYPKLDSSGLPASLSASIIETGLRNKLNYKGLIITDDMLMDGVSKLKLPFSPAALSIKAGVDMVMLTWSFAQQKKFLDELQTMMDSKNISKLEIENKLLRIKNLKEKIFQDTNSISEVAIQKNSSFANSKIKKLNANLLKQIIKKDLERSSLKKLNLKKTPLLIVEAPKKIIEEIKVHRRTKDSGSTEFLNIKSSVDWRLIKQRMLENKDLKVVLFIKNLTIIKNINWFTKEELSRFIVFNLQSPGLPYSKRYLSHISPYWTFENLYKELERSIQ